MATLKATDAIGFAVTDSVEVLVACAGPPGEDLSPWTAVDVGSPRFPGTTVQNDPGNYLEVCAGGRRLTSGEDHCHFAYQEVAGDFELCARVDQLSSASERAHFGLMVRGGAEALSEVASFVAAVISTNASRPVIERRERAMAGQRASRYPDSEVVPTGESVWMRLRREGANVIAELRQGNGEWQSLGMGASTLEGPALVGFVATAQEGTSGPVTPTRVRFSEIGCTGDASPGFLRGDCNDDGAVDISDPVCILNWLFRGGAAPGCIAVTNTNGDAGEDISDAVYVLTHLFLGGPAPVMPFPECGPGTLPTDEDTCETTPMHCQQ